MDQDRSPSHRIYFSDLAGVAEGSTLEVEGDEANHAVRVKRIRPGEPVALLDGRGGLAPAEVLDAESGKRPLLRLAVGALTRVGPVRPRIEVWCPPPKGDRLESMIDQLSQVGIAAWRPLQTWRTQRPNFRADRLERAAIEAAKQCGRAWLLEIGDWIGFPEALEDPRAVLADASGEMLEPGASGTDTVLLVGPEGGWTPQELEQARSAGRCVLRFGAHAMRIETAAVAASACLMARATHGGDG
ncbi:MAG: 16S rRNA (uracil(1498)-N(3))-methyltransferase [Phycisphaerales bacterium]|nr:16S rRNA (uracil(1498)-N(3))-methyltransferase [Planctomycetota bacterium]MCH8508836.1 16S rRNA (uracil(1498)-N(3))-methyltransferase [Phycisphaerales bacterium]